MSKIFVLCLIIFLAIGLASPGYCADEDTYARGVVFYDKNNNGLKDNNEKGLPKVAVSNGVEVVKTNRKGEYHIPVGNDTIVFVIKPTGWISPQNKDNLPQFYYIHKPAGSPELSFAAVKPTGPLPASIDFPLYPNQEPSRFKAIFLADTQPLNEKQLDYLAHDIVEELIGTDAVFGVTLGDIAYNRLYMHQSINKIIGTIGIPWFNVIGNHDENYDDVELKYSDDSFESVYGPPTYSYNYGGVHFIVLDNIHRYRKAGRSEYYSKLSQDQIKFIKNDLSLVKKKQLVVLLMHMPITETRNRKQLFMLLEKFPNNFSISGHKHMLKHLFLTDADGWPGEAAHHHVINGAACGSWWRGLPDERGIPISPMRDGTPNGYSIITFNRNQYSIEYKVANSPADYQMNIIAPDRVKSGTAVKVRANVFAGSEKSVVEMSVDNKNWIRMQRIPQKDPYYLALNEYEKENGVPEGVRKLPKALNSTHIWEAELPADLPEGVYVIRVKTTDMFGHAYSAKRIINVGAM